MFGRAEIHHEIETLEQLRPRLVDIEIEQYRVGGVENIQRLVFEARENEQITKEAVRGNGGELLLRHVLRPLGLVGTLCIERQK
ncbi:hypothetical protein [Tardiphaga sp. P5_C10]